MSMKQQVLFNNVVTVTNTTIKLLVNNDFSIIALLICCDMDLACFYIMHNEMIPTNWHFSKYLPINNHNTI